SRDRDDASVAKVAQEDLVGEDVELLLLLAVDVGGRGVAGVAGERRAAELARDDLPAERDPVQELGELSRGFGMRPLALQEVFGEGDLVDVFQRTLRRQLPAMQNARRF